MSTELDRGIMELLSESLQMELASAVVGSVIKSSPIFEDSPTSHVAPAQGAMDTDPSFLQDFPAIESAAERLLLLFFISTTSPLKCTMA